MHDIKLIKEDPTEFAQHMRVRGIDVEDHFIEALIKQRSNVMQISQRLLQEKNEASKQAGKFKAAGDEEKFKIQCDIVAKTKKHIAEMEEKAKNADKYLQDYLSKLPNLAMDGVPLGKDEESNERIHKWGDKPTFAFTPKEHYEIPAVSKCMDFEVAAKISGSRFVLLSGAIARVHRALAQFMLDMHTQKKKDPLLEINAPVIVNSETMKGTGQLPKFAEDCYKLHRDDTDKENITDHWLIPTSEVSLTNIVADTILDSKVLPLRYCAHSLCFRREAGSAGRDTAGMLRQHQFEKVEMVSITHPDESLAELDRMTKCAEAVLEKLELPYQTMLLCTGDMGFSAQRTHDVEVWLPGQNKYREISSCSVCGDFQARRMNARYREKDGETINFVHTLNGSGLAVGRCLIAVLENGQREDGSVRLPDALSKYLDGNNLITPDGTLDYDRDLQ